MTVEHQPAIDTTSLGREKTAATLLTGRWLLRARVGWIVLTVLTLGVFVGILFPAFVAQLQAVCSGAACTFGQLSLASVHALQELGLPPDSYTVGTLALTILTIVLYLAVSAVIFWRKSDDWMGLLVSYVLVLLATDYVTYMLEQSHSTWRELALVFNIGTFAVMLLAFTLFPDGRFVPGWSRWIAVGWIAWGLIFIFFFLPFPFSTMLHNFVWLAFIISLVVAQTYRYRYVSNPAQRKQTKWVIYGFAVGLMTIILLRVTLTLFLLSPDQSGLLYEITNGSAAIFTLITLPIFIGIAILRYRLYDIDVLINRTLVYSLLTAIIIGLYVLVVGSLSTLLQARGNLIISLLATGLIAILFQPIRERLQRVINRLMYGERDDPYHIISRLGTQLEATLTPDAILPTVAETVALALKLPFVAIDLQEEGAFHRVTAYGTASEPTLSLPLRHQQEIVGQMLLASRSPGESFSAADLRLLDDLARQAGIAANAVRLSTDLQRSRERLLLAREEERRRLARELHDSVSQALYGISLGTHAARTALTRDPERVGESLDYVLSLAEAALAEMRALIFELRPESLASEGLVSALIKQAAALQARHSLTVTPDLCEEPDLPLPTKEDLYRIAQEALHNTVKHARASHVLLRLDQTAAEVLLEVRDNGAGFDTAASFPGHLGLHSMRERVTNLGGTFTLESTQGTGTRVCVCIPDRA